MKDRRFLPTRTGQATGGANERQMLERVIDEEGFETHWRALPDGTVVMLQTRDSMPRFRASLAETEESAVTRGFLARAVDKTYGAIFDPYDLDTEKKKYTPAAVTYYVSAVQASAYEPRNWFDVWSWDGLVLRINGKTASSFYPMRYPDGVTGGMPYLIPWPSAPIYGTSAQNKPYPKRFFLVGKTAVGIATSGLYAGSEIPTQTLYPSTPRDSNKALVCGSGIKPGEHLAIMSQLYFTGDAWNSAAGGWEHTTSKVSMLLTPPYLDKVNSSGTVDLPLAVFGAPLNYTDLVTTEDITLPTTEIGAFCRGEVYLVNEYTYDPGGSSGRVEIAYPWSGVISSALQGTVEKRRTGSQYSATASLVQEQGGVELTYSASNTKWFDAGQNNYAEVPNNITILPGVSNIGPSTMNADTTTLFWDQADAEAGATYSARGIAVMTTAWSGSVGSEYRQYEIQNGEFSVTTDTEFDLVKVELAREWSTGQKAVILPWIGYYANEMADPYKNLWDDLGWGTICGPIVLGFVWYPGTEVVPIRNYYKVSGGVQDPSAVDDINNKYMDLASQLAGQTAYSNEVNGGIWRGHYTNPGALSDVVEDGQTLTWESRDFILYDEVNETYVYVLGEFEGEKGLTGDATATLTVALVVKTPSIDERKTLAEFTLTYANLFASATIYTGKTGIPSPKMRAIFTPAYRDQGAFVGAAFITQAEQSNGAAAAFLLNFVLKLEPYSFIGTAEPTDHKIHFVPCNLIEMLYAFVYSQEMGVHPTTRYPVTQTAIYSTIMAGLFDMDHAICFRDGAFARWLSALGNPYHDDQTAELSRV